MPIAAAWLDQHFHPLDAAASVPADGGIINGAAEGDKPLAVAVAFGGQIAAVGLCRGERGRGRIDQDCPAGGWVLPIVHGVDRPAFDGVAPIVVWHLPSVAPRFAACGPAEVVLAGDAHIHPLDIRSRVAGHAAQDVETTRFDVRGAGGL